MTEPLLIGLLSGVFGVLIATIPAVITLRKQPTRRTTDAISLVDASGTVIGNLSDEIHRLDLALDDAHMEAAAALESAKVCREQVAALKGEVERRPTREELLETIEKLRTQITGLGETPANGPRMS